MQRKAFNKVQTVKKGLAMFLMIMICAGASSACAVSAEAQTCQETCRELEEDGLTREEIDTVLRVGTRGRSATAWNTAMADGWI